MKFFFRIASILSLAFVFVSCSGSSSSSSNSNSTVSTGTFKDSAVNGLYYECGSHSGVTDTSGSFTYTPGDICSFWIGEDDSGIYIGQSETNITNEILTPIDIVPTDATNRDEAINNVSRFLLTLDGDGDPINGLNITAASSSVTNYSGQASELEIDFDQPAASFASDSNLDAVIGYFDLQIFPDSTLSLVSEAAAEAHLDSTLFAEYEGEWSGTFSGNTNGSWTYTVDSDGDISGTVSGSDFSYTLSGQVNRMGTAAIGTGDSEVTFEGTISRYTSVSGTWDYSGSEGEETGTWTGSKQ